MGASGAARRSAARAPEHALRAAERRARGAGDVEFLFEVVNQDGVVAMTQRSVLRSSGGTAGLGDVLRRHADRSVSDLGRLFTRDSILAYVGSSIRASSPGPPWARRSSPRGCMSRAAAMRRLIERRAALRAAMAARGETLPQLGVSPGFRDMRWPHPVLEGDVVSFSMEIVSKRETSKPNWGLVENSLRGINQRGGRCSPSRAPFLPSAALKSSVRSAVARIPCERLVVAPQRFSDGRRRAERATIW